MVVSPGPTTAVAKSLADLFADAREVSITVILDSDPEVYRMVYGEPTALVRLQEGARDSMFDLRLKIDEAFRADPGRFADSNHFRALDSDVQLFVTTAFEHSNQLPEDDR